VRSLCRSPTSFQLAGRVLLIFLFIGFVFQGQWSFARVLVSLVGLGACIMVVVGFKAKYSATFLVLLLSISNILINNWWSVHPNHPQKDYLRFDFFQTLSIVGGLLLLVTTGPGGLSMDEKVRRPRSLGNSQALADSALCLSSPSRRRTTKRETVIASGRGSW
jgi:uncharacterized membrane protein YphA (DoxX/SURF4 family)